MKVLVIPDIHLKTWIFDRAEEILKSGKAERAVCLMDIADDWFMGSCVERYVETYSRAIKFAKEYPDTLWCYGNHDVSYPWNMEESGYSFYAQQTVIDKLIELKNVLRDHSQLAFIHRIDMVLFTHGGLTKNFVRNLGGKKLLDADIDEVIDEVNRAPKEVLWNDGSPLWIRPQYRNMSIFRSDLYVQVVGHTPVPKVSEKNGVISTDVFSTYSNGHQIGESSMIVIDTETKKFEVFDVPGERKGDSFDVFYFR